MCPYWALILPMPLSHPMVRQYPFFLVFVVFIVFTVRRSVGQCWGRAGR